MTPELIILLRKGRVLQDEYTLDHYCIKEGDLLSMFLKTRGCNQVPVYIKYYLAKMEIQFCLFCDDIQHVKELIKKN